MVFHTCMSLNFLVFKFSSVQIFGVFKFLSEIFFPVLDFFVVGSVRENFGGGIQHLHVWQDGRV